MEIRERLEDADDRAQMAVGKQIVEVRTDVRNEDLEDVVTFLFSDGSVLQVVASEWIADIRFTEPDGTEHHYGKNRMVLVNDGAT